MRAHKSDHKPGIVTARHREGLLEVVLSTVLIIDLGTDNGLGNKEGKQMLQV